MTDAASILLLGQTTRARDGSDCLSHPLSEMRLEVTPRLYRYQQWISTMRLDTAGLSNLFVAGLQSLSPSLRKSIMLTLFWDFAQFMRYRSGHLRSHAHQLLKAEALCEVERPISSLTPRPSSLSVLFLHHHNLATRRIIILLQTCI